MQKIFLKIIILFLLVFSSLTVFNLLYTRTNYWKNTVTNAISKFKNVPEGIQLANVGSSHGVHSFDYNDVPCQSFNFALGAQLYLYDYAILRQYADRFSKNAILLIPISYFQINLLKNDFSDQRARYYHFLDKEYMDFYSISEKMSLTFYPVLSAGITLKFIIKDEQSTLKFLTEPELMSDGIAKHRNFTIGGNVGFDAGEDGFFHNKLLISQIIEFCYDHDIRPVLVTTPITSVLNDIFKEKTPAFFDNFYRFTRELQEAYPSLLYFDYSHDPRFENDFSLFRDSDHLNIDGAKKFTAVVISDLQTRGLLP